MKILFYRLFLILLLITLFSSCLNLKKNFTSFRLPIVDNGEGLPLKINGIYVTSSEKGGSFILFENGAIKWSGWAMNFWQDTVKGLVNIRCFNKNFPKDYWGHYTIKCDTIIIQRFNNNNEEIFKRWIHEFKGIIQSDTSILLLSWYSYWGKDQLLEEPIEYFLYRTNEKPDSTKAWFNNRSWFKKNLHESRKTEK